MAWRVGNLLNMNCFLPVTINNHFMSQYVHLQNPPCA